MGGPAGVRSGQMSEPRGPGGTARPRPPQLQSVTSKLIAPSLARSMPATNRRV